MTGQIGGEKEVRPLFHQRYKNKIKIKYRAMKEVIFKLEVLNTYRQFCRHPLLHFRGYLYKKAAPT